MLKKVFQIALIAGTVVTVSQSINVETAYAGSTIDLGSFLSKHSGKIDSLVSKYNLESVRDKYLKTDDNSSSNKSKSSKNDKFDLDSLLDNPTFRKFR